MFQEKDSKPRLNETEVLRLVNSCSKFLSGHYREDLRPGPALKALGEMAGPDLLPDNYGTGELIEGFEQEIAKLLGKEAAVFMPSGTMAQAIALRVWADRKGRRNVAFHPTCHLELHEARGYQLLHNLQGILVGSPDQLMTLADLKKVCEPLAALLIELPQREIGGQLPQWEDLVELVGWARERQIPLHLDGARLWECKPFYRREYAEIAGLFDTVYVSFYKILGGIAGSVLAGPESLIAEAKVWQHRQGGRLVKMYPFIISAKKGMAERLGKIESYYAKALEISSILTRFSRVEVVPSPPQTNMMHVFLRGEREKLEEAALRIAREKKTWLSYPLRPAILPGYSRFELTVGDAALDLTGEEIASLFETWLAWSEV